MSDLKFESVEKQVSYGIGRQMGEQLMSNPFEGLAPDAVVAGLADMLAGKHSQVAEADLQKAFQEVSERMRAKQAEQAKAAAADGEAYLAENGKREGVVTLASGLQYEVINEGSGDKPSRESTVRTHYHGTLTDGTVFDSSYQRGEPAEFPVGGVIAGWTEALQLMPVGSKWRLHIPYQLAYGERGAGASIPPFAALVFDVELLDIIG
ncbi:FKBP-type peptidyl-prolyl cis-trans isomerase [Simiduia agarivorans]|uniref:Peptidyl-prolyl cis-trans isomerase n=1 Tax=Simiduia agarivorans (strain DSM 21679 / JCM 13881 / BCRC 17597 / SA1) TaxID=1117647 RepID=K4KY99_SIMAS|nr:FKBP-type peptidyl-prolyl cis-trans isomerase [Simiduia agarivorans]AFU98927.1 peptidyl-prolyl cis-trans isomerase FklB [Simiduia agarivorans SA1 = DSM 21679]